MDASAPSKVDSDLDTVCDYYFGVEKGYPRTNVQQRNTIIKYTKLPDFDLDFDAKVVWPQRNSYTLPPRLRRIISLENEDILSSRSLKNNPTVSEKHRTNPPNFAKRKILSIPEDDEQSLHPKFSKEVINKPVLNKAVGTDNILTREKKRPISRSPSRYSRYVTSNSKTNNIKNENIKGSIRSVTKPKAANAPKSRDASEERNSQVNKDKNRNANDKDSPCITKTSDFAAKIIVKKKQPSEIEAEVKNRNKILENIKMKSYKRLINETKTKDLTVNEVKNKRKPISMIRVPLDVNIQKRKNVKEARQTKSQSTLCQVNQSDCCVEVQLEDFINTVDISVGTDPVPEKADKVTEMETMNLGALCESNTKKEKMKEFDSLDIPNVTLLKDKSDLSKELVKLCCQSLPDLQSPQIKITPHKDNKKIVHKSASYIIGRATLTYTTKQKINFHVVGNTSNDCSAPEIASSPIAYPMNVVSLYKKEIKKNQLCGGVAPVDNTENENDKRNATCDSNSNEIKSLNCSEILNSNKLVKPSEIISTIEVNNDLLQSDYICEQFQRELNFIDSFFESLQYLENCSLTEKCFTDSKVEQWVTHSGFDVKNPEIDYFFSKLENGVDNEDTETMASKSLCLLNLLIRDEQRRAKNLLFVLKMREDALKDFTKSQILWLENKKKQDNTDISTLKKKQRGALLKLQHECGEMQRMRKALLALSEKRKLALMKTKKNIEVKLRNNVNVDQIVLGKKKIKRNLASDRNIAPLKCFDLSSSGCDESTTSRPKSEPIVIAPDVPTIATSAEKCVQTGDLAVAPVCVNQSTCTAAENFVTVDGSYLNILFHNLALPQIFSSGKQYEVNEEALKNIVNSANTCNRNLNDYDVEKFIDQIKSCDLDKSSTPSTARSLVEEFDQYYKSLAEEDKLPIESTRDYNSTIESAIDHVSEDESKLEQNESRSHKSTSTTNTAETILTKTSIITVDESCSYEYLTLPIETELQKTKSSVSTLTTQAGPLPVPAGAAAVADNTPVNRLLTDIPVFSAQKSSPASTSESSASTSPCSSATSVSSIAPSPVHCEAEELRRQQLAIEREIKALEQQQCQLLVVREIPDKPPPPYTPPTDTRIQKSVRLFTVDSAVEDCIFKRIIASSGDFPEPTDPFELFIKDFCQETTEKYKVEQNDLPWVACNLLPPKPQIDQEQLASKTKLELRDVLQGITPTTVSGVGARRSDHIDDILFAEWRRCEPEWTSLHADEAVVKNLIFESIFQKILTETIDEYKKIVPTFQNTEKQVEE